MKGCKNKMKKKQSSQRAVKEIKRYLKGLKGKSFSPKARRFMEKGENYDPAVAAIAFAEMLTSNTYEDKDNLKDFDIEHYAISYARESENLEVTEYVLNRIIPIKQKELKDLEETLERDRENLNEINRDNYGNSIGVSVSSYNCRIAEIKTKLTDLHFQRNCYKIDDQIKTLAQEAVDALIESEQYLRAYNYAKKFGLPIDKSYKTRKTLLERLKEEHERFPLSSCQI